MSWSIPNLKRSYNCNPELIKSLRRQKNWSQKQFAERSGYSERLICKAESGGSIAPATIEVLAKTLSRKDLVVYPEDLICDPVTLSKLFIQFSHSLQENVLQGIASFLDPKFEYVFSQIGNSKVVFKGRNEVEAAFGKFFESKEIEPDQPFDDHYRYYVDGTDVISWGKTTFRDLQSRETYDLKITLRFIYRKGKLVRLEDRSEAHQNSITA